MTTGSDTIEQKVKKENERERKKRSVYLSVVSHVNYERTKFYWIERRTQSNRLDQKVKTIENDKNFSFRFNDKTSFSLIGSLSWLKTI